MNKYSFSIKKLATYVCVASLGIGVLASLESCSETVDTGNFTISKDETITDHLRNNAKFSDIYKVLQRVTLGSKENASPLSSVLAARGNYTIFAPTNEAMAKYITNLLGEGKTVDDLSLEQAQRIAYSCVIDNGSEAAYDSPNFGNYVNGAFPKGDLNNRSITLKQLTDSSKTPIDTYYQLNGSSRIVSTDHKTSNGFLHEVDAVIAPSSKAVPDLIAEAGNMNVMTALLRATGWDKKLVETLDHKYEAQEHETEPRRFNGVAGRFNEAQHRYFGFTGFVETDDVFAKEWGIPAPVMGAAGAISNTDEIVAAVRTKVEAAYGTEAQGDLTNEKNAINKFVAYHFLKGRMGFNQFVAHYNEWGYKYGDAYNPQQSKYSIDIHDYYTTVGENPELMKITQTAADHKIYLNRVATYNPSDYTKMAELKAGGVEVSAENQVNGKTADNNALNGYYFPINKILMLDKSARDVLGGERIRFDITTILPELLSYGCRSNRQYTYFPRGYFNNILNASESTRLLYLHSSAVGSGGWRDYEGDELMVIGLYDFVLKLPPVPAAGTYEIRMGLSNNSLRGMCQIYFGESPNDLRPAGLPVDMRQKGQGNDNIGWVADTKDESLNAENDKNMRNHGWMKAPRFFTKTDGKGDSDLRNTEEGVILRRIVTVQYLEPGKSYYLRFKSALNQTDSQFFSDYFELVPNSVFSGTLEPEDQW